MSGERLPKDQLIRSRQEIGKVIHKGKSYQSRSFTLYCLAGEGNKIGVLVGRRYGGAVRRNRIRRRIREIYRRNRTMFPKDMWMIFMVKPGVTDSFLDLKNEIICSVQTQRPD